MSIRANIGNAFGKLGAYLAGSNSFYRASANAVTRERRFVETRPKDSWEQGGRYTRETLMGLSRALYGNVGFVKGAIDDKAKYSVGSGIIPYSSCPDKSARVLYDEYFAQWCKIPEVRQTMDFNEICRGISRALDVDGDVGFILTSTPNGYPQIQAIESHRICSEYELPDFRDGVKLNGNGRPVAYRIRVARSYDEYYTNIPASSFIHIFEPERFDGVRGMSGLKHAIEDIRDRDDILAFEKLGVKFGSAIAGTMEFVSAQDMIAPMFGAQTQIADGPSQAEEVLGAAVIKLKQGEKLNPFSNNRPSPAFTGFLDYIDRGAAIGLGLPVEFIWNSKDLGGTSQRFILQKAQRTFEDRERTIGKAITKIRNFVIGTAIDNKELPASKMWWRVELQGSSKITVDVGREAAANRDDIRAGIRTEQEDIRERGKRFEDHRRDIQEAADDLNERAKQVNGKHTEIPLEACIQLMQQRNAGGGQIQFQPPTTGGSNGGSV